MSNGTLTPPPLSAVEIHDQAKDVLNAPPPTVAPPPPQPPVVATPTIQQQHQQSNLGAAQIHSALDSIQRNEFSVAITKLERLDMNVSLQATEKLSVASLLALLYMIQDTLPSAYATLTRLPLELQKKVAYQSFWELFSAVWERKFASVYSRAQSFHTRIGSSPVELEGELVEIVKSLTITFVHRFRLRTLTLLSTAYDAVPVALAESFLGLPAQELLVDLQKQGWTFDQGSQVFVPPFNKQSNGPSATSAASGPSTLNNFRAIAGSVTHLEL